MLYTELLLTLVWFLLSLDSRSLRTNFWLIKSLTLNDLHIVSKQYEVTNGLKRKFIGNG